MVEPIDDKVIAEPARRTIVREAFDVVVVGGGFAGVSAAVAAARDGASVCLLEKEFGLGGLATLGNVVVYLPLCDGLGHQISGGLADELIRMSVADGSHRMTPGGRDIPEAWKRPHSPAERAERRYATTFNPAAFAWQMETWLLAQGVQLRYDARFCAVAKRQERVTAVIIEDKGGRAAIACGAVVDASGDADVCLAAGEEIDSSAVNIPCGWFYYLSEDGQAHLAAHSRNYDPAATVLRPPITEGFACTDSRDVTAMTLASNRAMEARMQELRSNKGATALIRPPSIPSYRMTRKLRGDYELTDADDHRWFDDTVGLVSHWRVRGPVYAIPLRSLHGRTENLLVAGRCMSTARDVWDVTRAIQGCAVTGQAAGVAATRIAQGRCGVKQLDVKAVQDGLLKQNVILDRTLMDHFDKATLAAGATAGAGSAAH